MMPTGARSTARTAGNRRSVQPDEIKALRATLNLSRAALAQFLGVSEMSVVRWEAGGDHAPRGLQLVVLDLAQKAVARVGAEATRRAITSAVIHHGRALQALANAAYGER